MNSKLPDKQDAAVLVPLSTIELLRTRKDIRDIFEHMCNIKLVEDEPKETR